MSIKQLIPVDREECGDDPACRSPLACAVAPATAKGRGNTEYCPIAPSTLSITLRSLISKHKLLRWAHRSSKKLDCFEFIWGNLDAAKLILDRTYGKPKEKIEAYVENRTVVIDVTGESNDKIFRERYQRG